MKILLVFLLSCNLYALYAQRGFPDAGRAGAGRTGGGTSGREDSGQDHDHTPDTLRLEYYYQDKPEILHAFEDTLLHTFHEFDIHKIRGTTYLNLGLPGSPVRPLIPVPVTFTGFSLGLDSYQPYLLDDHNFRFYRSKKAFTHGFYTRGQTQNDGVLRVQFARHFADRLSFSFEYNRYVNFGIYNRQNGRNTNLGAGFVYESANGKLRMFATHYSNIFDQQHNGGITTDTLFNAEFTEVKTNIPTFLSAASARDATSSIKIHTHYKLFGTDSTSRSGIRFQHILRKDNHTFRFADTQLNDASLSYYQSFLVDVRGVRHYLRHRRWINDFSLLWGSETNRNLKLGLRHIINRIEQEPLVDNIVEYKAYGETGWSIRDKIKLETRGELNINRENATFLAAGLLESNLGKAGIIRAQLDINQQQPGLIFRKLFLNQFQIWENDFRNILVNHLRGTYSLPILRMKVTAGQLLINNPVYLDTLGIAQQREGIHALSYLSFSQEIKLGPFTTFHKITLQKAGNDQVFRVPGWYSEHQLDFTSLLFKKVLDFRFGMDLRLNGAYYGSTFLPQLGQFAVEERLRIPLYPYIDLRASFRVRYFRAFAIVHNVMQPFRSDVYSQIARYPYADLYLRLGISWIFVN